MEQLKNPFAIYGYKEHEPVHTATGLPFHSTS